MTVNGDFNHYQVLPFEFEEPFDSSPTNLFRDISNLALADKGDHMEILGINILKFDVFDEKMKANAESL